MSLTGIIKSLTNLSAPVGQNLPSREGDVRALRGGLEALGASTEEEKERDHEGKPLGIHTAQLDKKLLGFQKDNDLKVDGIVNPKGETVTTLGKRLTEKQLTFAHEAPPAYRREVFKGPRAKEWEDFYRQTENDPALMPGERRIFQDIFAAEGGMKKAPDSTAFAGIIQGTLDSLVAGNKLPNTKRKHKAKEKILSTDLDMEDVREFYAAYFDDAISGAVKGYKVRNPDNSKNGIRLLAELGSHVGASVADTLFKNGKTEGSTMIQESINEFLPQSEKISTKGGIGSETYKKLKGISADKKKSRSFLEILAYKRMQREEHSDREKSRIYNYLNTKD